MKKIISVLLAVLLLFSFAACAKEEVAEETTEAAETTDSEKITGMIYGVFDNDANNILSTEFSCNGGDITVERIAAGLSGWTGLKFRVKVTTDEENKKITINWLPESSLMTGEIPETQREEFTFADADAMRVFMLNSLCYSVRASLGEYDIYFTADGADISTLALEGLSSETAFNKTESSIVFVK